MDKFVNKYKPMCYEDRVFCRMAKMPKHADNHKLQAYVARIEEQRQRTPEWQRFKDWSVEFFASKQWKELRLMIIERESGLCQQCTARRMSKLGSVADHIIPRSWTFFRYYKEEGKKYEAFDAWIKTDNLQLLCTYCHIIKQKYIEMRMENGKSLLNTWRLLLKERNLLHIFEEWDEYIHKNYGKKGQNRYKDRH